MRAIPKTTLLSNRAEGFCPFYLSFIMSLTPQMLFKEGDFAPLPQRTLGEVWRHFWLSQLRVKTLLASSRQRTGMTLNMLQYTGQPPTTKSDPASNIKSSEVETLKN